MNLEAIFNTEWVNASIVKSIIGNNSSLIAIGLFDAGHQELKIRYDV
jgi:hypothetical protein